MAQKKYTVSANLPMLSLGKEKYTFQIMCDNSVLGTLEFSRGSIQWYTHKGKKPSRTLNWKQFADLMTENK